MSYFSSPASGLGPASGALDVDRQAAGEEEGGVSFLSSWNKRGPRSLRKREADSRALPRAHSVPEGKGTDDRWQPCARQALDALRARASAFQCEFNFPFLFLCAENQRIGFKKNTNTHVHTRARVLRECKAGRACFTFILQTGHFP